MKKIVSLFLALVMVLSLASFASADEPITVLYWHTRGSGIGYEVTKASVDKFNATIGAEKGINVVESYIGDYATMVTKLQLASQTDEIPTVAVCTGVYVGTLMDDDLLVDLKPLSETTNFNWDNLYESLLMTPGNVDGQIHSIPYIKSTPVLFYNKTLADEAGLTAPRTIEELEAFCKALTVVDASGETTRYGFSLSMNMDYFMAPWLKQMGQPYLAEDGSAPCFDGSLLKLLSDWSRWCDEGWCRRYQSSSAVGYVSTSELFFQGKVAATVDSSAQVAGWTTHMTDAGYELGIAPYPAYNTDTPYVPIGGAELVILAGNPQEKIDAGWQFIDFLMQDEQLLADANSTGYIPFTKSMASNEDMLKFWEENPIWKVAYDQLGCAFPESYPAVANRQEIRNNFEIVISRLIMENAITPEECVEQIKADCDYLFD